MRQWKDNLPEINIAVIGANGSGKSALTVKYITRRYISEYDPTLEDTFCKQDTINAVDYMIWIMDTVEASDRDRSRYLKWADVYLVLYDITERLSFEYAERLLKIVSTHDHSICEREHVTYLVGNKVDLDRYRQVPAAEAQALATKLGFTFFETRCTAEYSHVGQIFQRAVEQVVRQRLAKAQQREESRSPSTVDSSQMTRSAVIVRDMSSSDSDRQPRQPRQQQSSPRMFHRRSRTKSPSSKTTDGINKSATLPHALKKSSPSLKWFKSKFQRDE